MRKSSIDAYVKAFGTSLDDNAAAAIDTAGKDDCKSQGKLVDLMKERQTSLESAISLINDQGNIFATLSDTTTNDMRVGTDKTPQHVFVSERNNGGVGSETQAEINGVAEQIEHSASAVAEAEHAASARGMPTIDNHREREAAYAKEMLITAKSLSGHPENLATNKSTFTSKLMGGREWTLPGKADALSLFGVVGLAWSAKNLVAQIEQYADKSSKGTLTGDDKLDLARSIMQMIGSVSPYVPVIGPIASPFLAVANTVLDLIADNKHTPVEKVADTMRSRTSTNLFGHYPAITQP